MTIELYTHTRPEKQRLLIERIMARHGDGFATSAFMPEDEPGADLCWLEACADDDGLWSVRKVSTKNPDLYALDDDTELPERVETILPDICFFDALHYCAAFEISQPDQGMIAAENMAPPLMHYRNFAAQENIPFDLDSDLPAPVAGGQILSDGTFLASQRSAAQAVQNNLAATAPRKSEAKALVPAENVQTSRALSRFNENVQRGALVNGAEKRTNRLVKKFEASAHHDYAHIGEAPVVAALGASLTSGAAYGGYMGTQFFDEVASLLGFVGGMGSLTIMLFGSPLLAIGTMSLLKDSIQDGEWSLPRAAFKREMKKFRSYTKSLPDSDVKDHMSATGDRIELAFYKGMACHSFKRALKGGYFKTRRMNKDLHSLTKVMNAQGLDDSRQASILENVRDYSDTAETAAIKGQVGQLKKALADMDSDQAQLCLTPPSRALPKPGQR